MFRKMTPFLLISFICPGKCFTKFKRDFVRDNYTCVDYAFVRPDTRMSKCVILCATNSECKRIFFIPEDNNCMGCSTFESQPSERSISIGYVNISETTVPWNHLTYRYLGCYTDSANRVLNGPVISTAAMTNDYCFKYCFVDRDYLYFGTQFSSYCFCGNSYQGGIVRPEEECNSPCAADPTKICGGGWRNSIYVPY